MHYKNGREAHEGDHVVALINSKAKVGVLHSLVPEEVSPGTSNARLAVIFPGRIDNYWVRVEAIYHAEDAFNSVELLPKVPNVPCVPSNAVPEKPCANAPISAYDIAKVCHEANRAYCELLGDHSQKPWDQAEQSQRIKDALFQAVVRALKPMAIVHDDGTPQCDCVPTAQDEKH